mgnify:FL=1
MNARIARWALLAVAVVALLGVVVAFVLASQSQDRAVGAAQPATVVTTTAPTASATPSPTPSVTPTPTCADDKNQLELVDGRPAGLLPDCGQKPVTGAEQAKKGLGLACGGDYPVILYKSTTSGAKTSICSRDTVGDRVRMVVKLDGEAKLDLPTEYKWRLDAYASQSNGTRFVLHAVDGTLEVTRNGTTISQPSNDWISLDNEPDD